MSGTPEEGSRLPWFLAWLGVGATGGLGLLTIPTIGVYLLLVALAGACAVALRRGAAGLPGLLAGAGLPLLYVAYLNRRGPGDVCTTTATGQSCVEEWSPWLWLTAGLTLLLAGTAWFTTTTGRHRPK
ncbi:hypothetical protein ABZT03_19375 [Streptomyces sp. NPDC005574]|uniref:hypothetical protein n=1 Tax=Streptomyces sp. NPDC005574 TaxID=3156891 RepID=UPI0033A7DCB5